MNLAGRLKAGSRVTTASGRNVDFWRPVKRHDWPCSSLLVGRRGARRTDRDCVLTKEAYLDVCLYFHRVAKNFIWAKAPMPDGLDARFC